MAKRRVIIDTDPGTDDVLALLLALASLPEELEVLMISITYGNVDAQNCLRNVVSMFNVIEKEMAWRRERGLSEGFEMLKRCKPVVAVGPEGPLGGQTLMADYYHGVDGLGNVHSTHPHHTSPAHLWSHLFDAPPTGTLLSKTAITAAHTDRATHTTLFTPTTIPSHLEILRLLSSNPSETITLIAIGPLTNLALAASHSPQTFLKAKEVIVMSGAISVPGNITPVAEFNCIADPVAAARLYALTSPNPASTMPPSPLNAAAANDLPPYPHPETLGSRRLNLTLFPLDITTPHTLGREEVEITTRPLIEKGSPLAEWVGAFLSATFDKSERLYHDSGVFVCFHDPLCVWYALSGDGRGWQVEKGVDIRVETEGQWTRGMCVVDRRGMRMVDEGGGQEGRDSEELRIEIDEFDVSGDNGGWLSKRNGNRLNVCVGTPGARELAPVLLETLFGVRGLS